MGWKSEGRSVRVQGNTQRFGWRAVAWLAAVAGWLAGAASAQAAADALSARETVGPRVCLVAAQDVWGMPVAYASGFVLGEGRFVVTDLASVAEPGVKQVAVRFADGKTGVCREFGMADPSLGLVALRLEEGSGVSSGLALSADPPADGPRDAVSAGWRWGQDLTVCAGRVYGGGTTSDLASRLKVRAPVEIGLLSFEGVRPDQVSGAAVVEPGGEVVGVFLQVAGTDRTMIVPSAALRQALLSTSPQLRPLSELPKPLWPIAIHRAAGKAPTPPDLFQALRAVKAHSRCPNSNCGGKGTVTVHKVIGSRPVGGISQNIYRDVQETCSGCKGEGVVFGDGLYPYYSRMAEMATSLRLAVHLEPKAREAALASAVDALKALGKVGRLYRGECIEHAKDDLKPGAAYPRGVVVYALVGETLDGPDGAYMLLAPHSADVVLAAKVERLAAASDDQKRKPHTGRWIILGGVAKGAVALGDGHPILVEPYGWMNGPDLGGRKPAPGPGGAPMPSSGTDTNTSAPPSNPSGAPSFFGL